MIKLATEFLLYTTEVKVKPFRIKRGPLYKFVLLLALIAGMFLSFVSLVSRPEGVVTYGDASVAITYDSIHLEQLIFFMALTVLFVFLISVITFGFDMMKDVWFAVSIAFASFVMVMLFAVGVMSSNDKTIDTYLDSSDSVEAIVGPDFKATRVDPSPFEDTMDFYFGINYKGVDADSLKAIVDSNLGDDYKVVKSDSGVTYVDSDGSSYKFVKAVEVLTAIWTLEEVK
jgi:hypothetical protein